MESKQWTLLLALVLFSAIFHVILSIDCSDKEDGVYERGCKAFTRCVNGTAEIVSCQNITRFNPETNQCDYHFHVPPPCGTYRSCEKLSDGRYPNIELNCQSFYTCLGGIFLGHTPCSPGLVFNTGNQVCDWPHNVTTPCGTR